MTERSTILNYFEVEMGDKIPRAVAQVMFDATAMHVLIAGRLLQISNESSPMRQMVLRAMVRTHGEALAYCIDSLKQLANIPDSVMEAGFQLIFDQLIGMDKRVNETAAEIVKRMQGGGP
jgi:hypothetical protein